MMKSSREQSQLLPFLFFLLLFEFGNPIFSPLQGKFELKCSTEIKSFDLSTVIYYAKKMTYMYLVIFQ